MKTVDCAAVLDVKLADFSAAPTEVLNAVVHRHCVDTSGPCEQLPEDCIFSDSTLGRPPHLRIPRDHLAHIERCRRTPVGQ